MAEHKVQKAWYTKWWAIILFIFVGLIILGNLFGEKETTKLNNNIQTDAQTNTQQETKTAPSKDFCHSLIPDRMDLGTFTVSNGDRYWSNYDSYLKPFINKTFVWNDGTPIDPQITISFSQGRNAGENVNLAYSRGLAYSKTPISSDGTIGKEISYRMILVLDPNDKNTEGYKIVAYRCCQNDVGVSYCRPQDAQLKSL